MSGYLVSPWHKHCGLNAVVSARRSSNELDEACRQHDIQYQKMLDKGLNPYIKWNYADTRFINRLKWIVKTSNLSWGEKALISAIITAGEFKHHFAKEMTIWLDYDPGDEYGMPFEEHKQWDPFMQMYRSYWVPVAGYGSGEKHTLPPNDVPVTLGDTHGDGWQSTGIDSLHGHFGTVKHPRLSEGENKVPGGEFTLPPNTTPPDEPMDEDGAELEAKGYHANIFFLNQNKGNEYTTLARTKSYKKNKHHFL